MHNRLPHVSPIARQPIVFITTVTNRRRALLDCEVAYHILRDQWTTSRDRFGWCVGRFVVMPDHVHLFARAAMDAIPLAEWIRRWKGATSRDISQQLSIEPPVWQCDYFDRFLRSSESYSEKWDYVVNNPVRRNLAVQPNDWPWQGVIEDLSA